MWKIGLRLLLAGLLLLAVVFGSAGRWNLPFAWAYIVVLAAAMAAAALVVDPGLLNERARPGPGGIDRNLRFIVLPFFAAHLVVAGLDVGRYEWTGHVAIGIQLAGIVGLAASMALSVWAASVNRFFSPVVRIQTERGHHVVTGGPYRLVRHPGYTAASVSMLCSGPALGSWWSLLALAPLFVLIFRRTVIEDRYLHDQLDGYVDYAKRVPYRLIPGVW